MTIDLVSISLQALMTVACAFVGSYIMWRVIGPRVVYQAIQARMGPILLDWLMKPSIPSGRRRKNLVSEAVIDEDGKELSPAQYEIGDEVLSPIETIITRAGDTLFSKVYGKMGGDVRRKQAIQGDIVEGLRDSQNPFGMLLNDINPMLLQRCIKDGDYIPILLEQFGPLAKELISKKLNSGGYSSL